MSPRAARLRRALERSAALTLALTLPLVCAQLVAAQTGGGNAPPSASFTASPNPARVGQAVAFNASASADSDGTITKYEWDLDGNGSFETNTGTRPTTSKTYAENGKVNVRLRVTDDDGATAQATVEVEVANRKPVASFTASPNPAQVDQRVTFDASSSFDRDGTIVKYEWDLDSGSRYDDAVGVTASRSFSAAGSYSVGLRVTDNDGGRDTATLTVTVTNAPPPPPPNQSPVASFTALPNPSTAGQTVQFNAGVSSDSDGTVVSYDWDFDDDGQFDDASGVIAPRSFPVAGFYTVRLRVTDDRGGSDVSASVVTVQNGLAAAGALQSAGALLSMSPFPVVRIVGRSTASGAKIARLEVRGAPRGAMVTVRCAGRGCRSRQARKLVRSYRLRFRSFERRLRAGAVIRVFVTQTGRLGKYTSFKIRRGRTPVRRDLCVVSVASKPAPCPPS